MLRSFILLLLPLAAYNTGNAQKRLTRLTSHHLELGQHWQNRYRLMYSDREYQPNIRQQVWDPTSAEWKNFSQRTYSECDSLRTSFTDYQWYAPESNWKILRKVSFHYGEGNLQSKTEIHYDEDANVLSKATNTFTYNSKNQLVAKELLIAYGKNRQKTAEYRWTYWYRGKKMIKSNRFSKNAEKWEQTRMDYYYYRGKRLSKRKTYSFEDDYLFLSERERHFYKGNHHRKVCQIRPLGKWRNVSKQLLQYAPDGKVAQRLHYQWEGEEWQFEKKLDFHYQEAKDLPLYPSGEEQAVLRLGDTFQQLLADRKKEVQAIPLDDTVGKSTVKDNKGPYIQLTAK